MPCHQRETGGSAIVETLDDFGISKKNRIGGVKGDDVTLNEEIFAPANKHGSGDIWQLHCVVRVLDAIIPNHDLEQGVHLAVIGCVESNSRGRTIETRVNVKAQIMMLFSIVSRRT